MYLRRLHFIPALVGLILYPLETAAHDMPSDVVVQIFAKPSGDHLHVLMRLPLAALLNLDLPKRGTEYLDLDHIELRLREAAGITASAMELFQGDQKLTPVVGNVRVSLPSDKSFVDYASAESHVSGPRLSPDTDIVWDQGFLDSSFDYQAGSSSAQFAIHPHFQSLAPHVTIALRFLSSEGIRAFELGGDPGLVRLDPRWYQAALTFVRAGFLHILSGADHLLFLLCLVVPVRRFRRLVPVITAFTLAHSITLIASACDFAPSAAWFPPLIEVLIAFSIVYMALENILVAQVRHRASVAFGFGLVHGFGFSFALRNTLQFAGKHLLTSLLSFNAGVELGQLFVLAVFIPLLTLIFRIAVSERIGVAVVSGLACDTAWRWMTGRASAVMDLGWTTGDILLLARYVSATIFVGCAFYLFLRALRSLSELHLAPKVLYDPFVLLRGLARSEPKPSE